MFLAAITDSCPQKPSGVMFIDEINLPIFLYFGKCFDCLFTMTANDQVLPMVGELENVRLATEVHYLFKD